MTPKSSGATLRTALTACVLMATLTASCAQTPPPALLPQAAAQSQQVLAAKRIVEAIQSVNWSSTNEADARKTMETAMEPFGMTFSYFNLDQPTVDRLRRMDATLIAKPCLSPAHWAAGIGQPIRIDLRMTHQFQPETSPEMIRRIISAEERRFGPNPSSMVYPPLSRPTQLQNRTGLATNTASAEFSSFLVQSKQRTNKSWQPQNCTTQSPIFQNIQSRFDAEE